MGERDDRVSEGMVMPDAAGAGRCALALVVALALGWAPVAAAAEGVPVSTASVVVTDPNMLPPPGTSVGWVDHPCSHELLYHPHWIVNGHDFNAVFAQAHDAILTDIGTPTLTTQGSDVLSTFSATLHVAATVVAGITVSTPLALALPGTITARFVGKAGKTTGTFLVKIESMNFSATLYEIPLASRQDPDRESAGSLTVTSIGGGSYRVWCSLDAYTQISAENTGVNPPQWLPYTPDVNAPLHLELNAASCPPGNYPLAGFAMSPAPAKAGQTVTLTDASTGAPTLWAWDFGDGATSTQHNPTHAWAAAGTYAVRLTVTNAYGSDSYGTLLTVTGPPGPHQVHRVLPGHRV
jgi:hypothetical protein